MMDEDFRNFFNKNANMHNSIQTVPEHLKEKAKEVIAFLTEVEEISKKYNLGIAIAACTPRPKDTEGENATMSFRFLGDAETSIILTRLLNDIVVMKVNQAQREYAEYLKGRKNENQN